MRIRSTLALAAALALAIQAAPASAQLFNSPTFMPPVGAGGPSVYVVDGDGIDLGIAGAWRGFARSNVGFRVGFFDTVAGSAFSGGIETWGTVMNADDAFPVDVAWTVAGGATFGDGYTTLWVPVGATVGRVFVLQQVSIQPYAHPQVGLGVTFTDVAGSTDTNTDLNVQIDIGAEVAWNEQWKLRLAFSQGDSDAVGIGAAFHF